MAAALVLAGVLQTWWTVQRAEKEMREALLQQAQPLARALNTDTVRMLSGSPDDANVPEYQRLKAQLAAIKPAYENTRFIYLLGRKPSGDVFFFVDNEPEGSPDMSPPGQVYDEAPAGVHQAFDTRRPVVAGPFTDRWGSWVSTFVPVPDLRNGELIAVLGMDIQTEWWKLTAARAGVAPARLTAVLIALLLTGNSLMVRRSRLGTPARWTRHLEPALALAAGLAVTVYASWTLGQREEHARNEAFALTASARSNATIEKLRSLSGTRLEGLAEFMEASEGVTATEFRKYTRHLMQDIEVHAWGWCPAIPAANEAAFEAEARTAGLHGFSMWQEDEEGNAIPVGGRDTYYPILHVEPRSDHATGQGYDLGSEPAHRSAIEASIRTGMTTATDPIHSIHKPAGQPGMFFYRAVFDSDRGGVTRGVVWAEVRVDALLQRASQDGSSLMDIALIRGSEAPQSLAADWDVYTSATIGGPSFVFPMFASGRVFTVTAHAGETFLHLYPARAASITAFAGLLFSAALANLFHLTIRRRVELERLVAARTVSLRESEERLWATLRSIGDGVISCDGDGRVASLNRVAEKLTGWSVADAIGRPIGEVFHIVDSESGEVIPPPVNSVAREVTAMEFGDRVVLAARDGAEYRIADSCAPIRDAEGAVIGTVLVFRDVTEEHRQRAELADQRRWIEYTLGITNIGITVIDSEFNVHYVDPAWRRVYGDPTGRKSYEYFMGTDEPSATSGIPEALASKRTVITEQVLPRENNRVVEVHTMPFQDSDGQWMVAEFNVDITERKRVAASIERNAERLKALVEILQYRAETAQGLLEQALDKAIAITESGIGFVCSYDEDQTQFVVNAWSKEVMSECSVENPATCFELANTGVWGEAVRQRKPIVINDFETTPMRKKGYPEGHVRLERLLAVPVFQQDRIVAVVGVANKAVDYDETDVLQLTLLMDAVWKSVESLKTEDALRASDAELRSLFSAALVGLGLLKGRTFHKVNAGLCRITGYAEEELLGQSTRLLYSSEEEFVTAGEDLYGQMARDGQGTREARLRRKDGSLVETLLCVTPFDPADDAAGACVTVVDITERNRQRDSLLKTQFTVDRASESVIWVGDAGEMVYVNDSACASMGYSRDELLSMTVFDIDPDFPFALWEEHKAEIRRVGSMTFETRHRTKDGRIFPVEVTSNYFEFDGRFMACTFDRDITERKRAEAALREKAALLEAQANATIDGIVVADDQKRLLLINQRMKELFQIPPHVLDDDDATPLLHYLSGLVKNPEPLLEKLNYLNDHHDETSDDEVELLSGMQVERYSAPVVGEDGKYYGRIWTFRDVTERKRAEQALEKRMMALLRPLDDPEGIAIEELFNLQDLQCLQDEFAQATGVASLITHPDGTPITKPSNFCRLCSDMVRISEVGRARCEHSDALVGRASMGGASIQPCLSAGLWNSGAAITVGGRHIANWLIGQVRDDTVPEDDVRAYAREIDVDEGAFLEAYHEVPIMAQSRFKEISQVLVTLANQLSASAYQNVQQARSITERERAKEEREKLREQLAQSQKMESVGRLAGGVAHDFNNMLGVILGHAELALDRVDPMDPIYADLHEIRKAAERSADLTRQLLAFARKQTVAPKVFDLNETVEGMLKMLRRLIGEDIDLAWLPGQNAESVKMDPSQLDQLLANLCVNARDAIGDTGRIVIETGAAMIDDAYCADYADVVPGDYAVLTVSDDGCGMAPEMLAHLFEPFFTTKETGKGTGLGLATVYGIVKQNKGFINVYSEPSHGTTFKVFLPRHSGDPVAMAKDVGADPAVRGSETILVVEDEPAILKLTARLLQKLGYTVVSASTPGEAIRLATNYPGEIHLLITDVIMPQMNGRDLAQHLVSLHPQLKRLFMSGYTANVIAHHGVLDDGVHFIRKPFTGNELAAKVRETLTGS